MLSKRVCFQYVTFSQVLFRLEKCLEFSFTILAQSEQHVNWTDLRHWPVF